MNQADVDRQLSNMIQFIQKEARERAEELKDEAEQEFNKEKQKIIQENKKKINAEFERKKKQVEIRKKIAYSNELNQSRLTLLKAREDALQEVFTEACRRLHEVDKKPDYPHLIEKLIVQGLLKLKEPEISVICREVDNQVVESVLASAARTYEAKSKQKVKLVIDHAHRLAPPASARALTSCAGGVLLTAKEGRILCNNTLEQRLGLAYDNLLPEIRTTLFGRSASRKFLN